MTSESEVLDELRLIRRLLVAQFVSGLRSNDATQKDAIVLLDKAGLAPREIADALATTPNTVSVTLSKERRKTEKS